MGKGQVGILEHKNRIRCNREAQEAIRRYLISGGYADTKTITDALGAIVHAYDQEKKALYDFVHAVNTTNKP